MSERRLVLATRNVHKVVELRAILADVLDRLGLELVGLDAFQGLEDVVESGVTFAENALIKARALAAATGLPAVADGLPTMSSRTRARSSSVMTSKATSTSSTPSRATTASPTRRWISLRSGQPGTVRAISTRTLAPCTCTPRTMPRSTMLRWSSGSSTGRRASMIWDSVGTADLPTVAEQRGISPTRVGRIPACTAPHRARSR